MNTKLSIKIRKRSQSGWLLSLLVMMPFLFGTLNDLLGLPHAVRYLLDAVCGCLLLLLCLNPRFAKTKGTGNLLIWAGCFLVYTFLVYLVQFRSPAYYIWGVRNNFRFYVAFFAAAVFLTREDAAHDMQLFDRLFWLNAAVSLIQCIFFDIDQDYLGGIFGTEQGCNAYTNVFFLIVISRSVVLYLEKEERAAVCAAKCVTAMVIAALAELKFFFAEFLLIIGLAVLFTHFTWRKFWLILGGAASAVLGAALLTRLFPQFAGWFSLKWFWEVAAASKGYTSTSDLNRLTAIPQINELWLSGWGERLFGLGLGNCDTSSFWFLNTPFYQANGDMHYTWISYAFLYLETGYVGLIFYFGFFAGVYFRICRIERHGDAVTRNYCRIARIIAILCIPLAVYNASLRSEPAYLVYVVLAIPFALARQFADKEKRKLC